MKLSTSNLFLFSLQVWTHMTTEVIPYASTCQHLPTHLHPTYSPQCEGELVFTLGCDELLLEKPADMGNSYKRGKANIISSNTGLKLFKLLPHCALSFQLVHRDQYKPKMISPTTTVLKAIFLCLSISASTRSFRPST